MSSHFERGKVLLEQKRYDLAVMEFRKELSLDPEDAASRSLLAHCLYLLDRDAEAEAEARTAIAGSPDLAFGHYVHSKALEALDRLDEAEISAREAIRLDPEESEYFGGLATILLDGKRPGDALESAEEGLALDPGCELCSNVRAMALIRLGRAAEAAEGMSETLGRNPESGCAHANQGWAFLHLAKREEALEHFREALRLEPGLDWAREGMIEALKARHTIYAVMLRYFLWMSRLSMKAQIGVIIGGYIGYRLLRSAAKTDPTIAPFLTPLIAAYVVFAYMTWVADPLFNLILLMNRFGRYALTKADRAGALVFGALLASALASAGIGLLSGWGPGLLIGLAFALGSLLSAQTFSCPPGWRRRAMAAYSIAVSGSALAGAVLSVPVSGNPNLSVLSVCFIVLALLGFFFSSIIANVLILSSRK